MSVPGNRCLREVRKIDPDVVLAPVMMQLAVVGAQMSFELATVHDRAFILASRLASTGASASAVLA